MTHYIIEQSDEKIQIGKIICLARTYKKHAQEMNAKTPQEPLLFLKPESSIIFNNGTIISPPHTSCIHHEVELGVVIGKKGKNISQNSAMNHILGYLVALDVTARDIQSRAKKNGWPWSISKGFDTFCPISNVVKKNKVDTPLNLSLQLFVNKRLQQQSNTKYMMFPFERIIEYISSVMTLKKGDLILTGTPEGVGEIKPGDSIKACLGNICELNVTVQK
jgi:2-keto-4-pentenoate hydratase/2-oxohepta-3-ene-1,7-dioic acid hydratase in catechol pathway